MTYKRNVPNFFQPACDAIVEFGKAASYMDQKVIQLPLSNQSLSGLTAGKQTIQTGI
jgi:hypothetical protein